MKWSDFCISAVRYNQARTHIDAVRVHQHLGESLSNGEVWSRQRVVSTIDAGYTFTTVVADPNRYWFRGAAVNVVQVGGERFLRTDRDQWKADNLGNLPELAPEPQALRYY